MSKTTKCTDVDIEKLEDITYLDIDKKLEDRLRLDIPNILNWCLQLDSMELDNVEPMYTVYDINQETVQNYNNDKVGKDSLSKDDLIKLNDKVATYNEGCVITVPQFINSGEE